MKVSIGDIVQIKPSKGCCNSTLCMWEWEVMDLGQAKFSFLIEPMAIIKSGDNIEFVHVDKLEVIKSPN